MLTQLINARILTPQGWLKDGSVLIRDGKILEVTNCDLAVIGAQLIDVKGMYVLPGGVEIHAHGGRGGDFRGGNGHGHRLGDGDGLMDLNGGCAVAVDDSDPVFAFGDFEFGNAAFAHEVDQCLEFAQIHDGLGLVI